MELRDADEPFRLSLRGATLVAVSLYGVGGWLAVVTDARLFLVPGHVAVVACAVVWGTRQHRRLRGLGDRYEDLLRHRNGV
ncbi:hypothetical protein JKP75_02595 [Blastococcus sp. TML/M2B]|uniref:hypothetical protein n=1 Tax=unclassified Blastococcus TaxID=2619396 RepID=UPI00190E0800|nr:MULTISPECIES: hypothetical protein [unclassified Blastococcus]MBN1091562.1 hypothetical protein [Blastococcus sp. TML/M2B]MBN1094887.1 hypothetical protein [Blastococcus sp. TML/C7B]